jgi:hypothetical protein
MRSFTKRVCNFLIYLVLESSAKNYADTIGKPEETSEELRAIAQDWDVPLSLLGRAAIEDFLNHPERTCAVLLSHLGTIADTRTPEQREAQERYERAMLAIDLEAIAAQMCTPAQVGSGRSSPLLR